MGIFSVVLLASVLGLWALDWSGLLTNEELRRLVDLPLVLSFFFAWVAWSFKVVGKYERGEKGLRDLTRYAGTDLLRDHIDTHLCRLSLNVWTVAARLSLMKSGQLNNEVDPILGADGKPASQGEAIRRLEKNLQSLVENWNTQYDRYSALARPLYLDLRGRSWKFYVPDIVEDEVF